MTTTDVVSSGIDAIVAELRASQADLTGVRGPTSPEASQEMARQLERYAGLKGRGAFLPFLGSGRGNGALVELVDGSVKWDMITGIGVHGFGHCEPELTAIAMRAAMGDTVMQGNLQCNQDVIDFSATLLGAVESDTNLRHAFLTNSGAMANESALKVCFQKCEPASRVIAFEHCFMGRSTALSQIGDSAGGRSGIPLNMLVDYLPFYDAADPEGSTARTMAQLETYITRYPKQHACFVFEPVQGEGGFNTTPPAFLRAIIERCREAGIAIWADEVQTFGRTEALLHVIQLGIGHLVDVVTIGKMSQVCACLYSEAFNPRPGLLSGTFIGSTVGLAVGCRIVERLMEDGYYGADGRNATLQAAFREQMASLVERHPNSFPPVGGREVYGGVGGMLRMTPFGGDKAKVTRLVHVLFEEGVIAFFCGHGPYHLRFLPPVGVIEPAQLADVFEILDRSVARVAAES